MPHTVVTPLINMCCAVRGRFMERKGAQRLIYVTRVENDASITNSSYQERDLFPKLLVRERENIMSPVKGWLN